MCYGSIDKYLQILVSSAGTGTVGSTMQKSNTY